MSFSKPVSQQLPKPFSICRKYEEEAFYKIKICRLLLPQDGYEQGGILSELILPKVTVILRGYETKQVLCVVEQLVGTKVNSIEVASNSPHAMESIAAARKEFGSDVHVGAGTVKNEEIARQAIAAGAEFMLSPIMFTREIFDLAKAAGVIAVPAAFSPTEVQKMIDMGADIVKIFPAGQLGPDYIKAIQAPLGKLPLMVVGGVSTENVQSYFDKGATYAGIGSGVFDPADIEACDSANLAESIKRLEENVSW